MLGDDEAVAVAVTLAAASDAEDPAEPSPAARALVRLNRVLPSGLRERVNALVAGTSVVADRRPSVQPEPEVALTLAAELAERFSPPDGFDVVEYVMQGLAFGAWTHRTEVWKR
jgi:predicted DNA-binding transcriptional regulator YafY